ncbi:MAG TPA: dienelactone hydrolase family protein [Pseudolabrys sp.]|nr:dienelactone hydrolase family protein [Pseudolabrys sp.]
MASIARFPISGPWRAVSAALATIIIASTCHAGELVTFKATNPYLAKNVTLRADLFLPRGDGPFPAVVLMHGCGGWQPAVLDALNAHAMNFLDNGYAVLNLDSFGPRGKSGGVLCASDRQLQHALNYRLADAYDALRYLRTHRAIDPRNIYLLGQSNGGSVAIDAAKMLARAEDEPGFRAVAAYYPWCGSLGPASVKLNSPLIIFSGGRDNWTPAWQCRGRRSPDKALSFTEYPKATHSFDVRIEPQRYLGKLIGYDREATMDSRTRMLAFFERAKFVSKPVVAEPVVASRVVANPVVAMTGPELLRDN